MQFIPDSGDTITEQCHRNLAHLVQNPCAIAVAATSAEEGAVDE